MKEKSDILKLLILVVTLILFVIFMRYIMEKSKIESQNKPQKTWTVEDKLRFKGGID